MLELLLLTFIFCILCGIFLSGMIQIFECMRCPSCGSRKIELIQCRNDLGFPVSRVICSGCLQMYDRFRGKWRKVK